MIYIKENGVTPRLRVRQDNEYCVSCQAMPGEPCIDIVYKHMTGGTRRSLKEKAKWHAHMERNR
jgi:hypothetical protein